MTTLLIAALVCAAVASGIGGWLLWTAIDPLRRSTQRNLYRRRRPESGVSQAQRRSDVEVRLAKVSRKLTPNLIISVLDRQHALVGRPAAWPVDTLLSLKLIWLVVAVCGNLLIFLAGPPPLMVLPCVVVTIVGYFLPELLLYSEAQKRTEKIQLELADTLDQMTIAVEAGLGFDGAMARAGQNGKGPLAEELVRTLQDIRMGHSRRQAFESLTNRTNATDLRRFVRAVIQADMYGVSVAGVLKTQADEMRLKRRQRAEEQAQKIPVKVLAPLMLCILPVLFIVVMGPAVLNMMEAFGGM